MSSLEDRPLFSDRLRYWVLLDAKGGRDLNQIKSRLEKKSAGQVTSFRGAVIGLELDKGTNQLTVWSVLDAALEPEVVDYDEFKKFVLRDRD